MAARLDAPVIGAQESPYDRGSDPWEATFTWRYQKSDRHFRGSHEETNRQAEHSEVINTIHLLDLAVSYHLDDRWSLSLSVPYLLAERSSPIRDDARVTIGRSVSQARAVSDMVVSARRWMLDPETHPGTNVRFGFGIKFPTGRNNVTDTRTRFSNGEYVTTVQTVDQSIQPGDGGFGALLDVQWFRRAGPRASLYGSASYLFNPEGTSGVLTYRSREAEAVMSIADQYLARVGAGFRIRGRNDMALGIGGRIEGVPAEDLIGPSDGFRRPGYAVSVEPSWSLSSGANTVTLAVPVALYRNRVRSVPDRDTGRHGDAAFADYLVLVSYSRRFGGLGTVGALADPGQR